MNTYNLQNKIVIQIEELEGQDLLPDYAIYKYDSSGCLLDTPFLTGVVPSNLKLDLVLPDGKYNIQIESENVLGDLQEDLFVFYNRLPHFTNKFKDIFCCQECKDGKEEALYKTFFELSMFLNCTNLLEILPTFKNLSCINEEKLETNCQYQKHYGVYNFDYIVSIKEFLLIFVLELYNYNIAEPRYTELDLIDINTLFGVEEITNCARRSNMDIDKVMNLIQTLKCNCNE